MAPDKKNITLTLSMKDFKELEEIKNKQALNSFTKIVLFLKRFYEDNYKQIDELRGNELPIGRQLKELSKELRTTQNQIKSQSHELDGLKAALDLVLQNNETLTPLLDEYMKSQDKFVTKASYDALQKQVHLLSDLTEQLINRELTEADAAKTENEQIKALLRAKENLRK